MSYADSAAATVTLNARGVWLHDALDPSGTASPFPYGSAQRDTAIDAQEVGTFFAGRVAPVFDYGEHIGRSYGCTVDVPHGSTYRADLETLEGFAESKRPLWFRDNRGRAVYGTMTNFKHSDQPWGSVCTFVILEADRDVTTVVA